ncbi:MAG: hypothetical protein V4598_10265 [Bdellovibrionota bacterium]
MNKLKAFFAILLTVVTLTHSKPSQAAVGLFTGGSVAVVGLAVIGTGVVGGWIATEIVTDGCSDLGCLIGIVPFIAGLAVAAIGVVILDGEQTVEFKELDKVAAKKLGINELERASFNAELDEANMLLAEVASEMTKIQKPTAQDSVSAWSQVKDMVSAETFSAMQKIAAQK